MFSAEPKAKHIKTDIVNFSGLLSSADTTVQKALDTLDDIVLVGAFADLSDVVITTPTLNDFLKYDGSEWVNFDLFGTANTWSAAQVFNSSLGIGVTPSYPFHLQASATDTRAINIDQSTNHITSLGSTGVYLRQTVDAAGGAFNALDFQVDLSSSSGRTAQAAGIKGTATKAGTFTGSDIGTLVGVQALNSDASIFTYNGGSTLTKNHRGGFTRSKYNGNLNATSGTVVYNVQGGYFEGDTSDSNTNAGATINTYGGYFLGQGKTSPSGTTLTIGGYFEGVGGDTVYDMYLNGTGEIHSNVGQLLLTASDANGITGSILAPNLAVYDVDNLGAEIVTNPQMTTDTGWTKGTGWTFGTTAYDYDGDGTGNLDQDVGAANSRKGIYYFVTWQITNYVSGSVRILLGGNAGSAKSANGVYKQTIKASDTDNKVTIDPVGTSQFSITLCSVKPFSGGELSVQGDFYRAGSTDFFYDDHTFDMQIADKDFIWNFISGAASKTVRLDTSANTYDFGDTALTTTGTATVAGLIATANLDIGAFSLTALNLISDVATGTQPYACTSTTLNTNLNADLLDGLEANVFLKHDGSVALSGAWDLGNFALTNVNIDSGVITGITDLLVADGGTGVSSLTAYAVLCGGTTSTGAIQSIAGVGTSGQVLTSNGAGALPTFQDAAGGSPGGVDTYIQFNDGGLFGGDAGLTYNKTTNNLTLAGDLSIGETAFFDAEFDNGNSGATDTIDWGVGNKQKSTLTSNVTYTFTDPGGACNLILKLVQDATGGREVTWPATVKWSSGVAPAITSTANAIDIVSLYFDGTNYYGQIALDFT